MRSMLHVVAVVAALVASLPVTAQVTPDRTYYGVDRAVPMTVARPGGAEGELSIALLDGTGETVAEASVIEGRVDLAALFPVIWTDAPQLRYAQLVVGDGRSGPAVVLQPLTTPRYAQLMGGALRWSPQDDEPIYAGLRTYVDKLVLIETTEGAITLRLRPDEAPNTSWNFRTLVEGGFYTDLAFHRVVPTSRSGEPFVAQAGDPTGTGMGGPGYFIDLEPSEVLHDFGVLSMARSGDPNTNGSQFFLALSRSATQHLDGAYTAFGQAVGGADAIVRIAETPILEGSVDKPVTPPRIVEATLIDAPPRGQGPEPVTRPEQPPVDR